jgi:hypothetical protein
MTSINGLDAVGANVIHWVVMLELDAHVKIDRIPSVTPVVALVPISTCNFI